MSTGKEPRIRDATRELAEAAGRLASMTHGGGVRMPAEQDGPPGVRAGAALAEDPESAARKDPEFRDRRDWNAEQRR